MITTDEIREKLKEAIAAEGSQTAFANKHDFTLTYLNDMLQGRRPPSAKLLDAAGYEAVTMYRKKP